VGKWESYGIFPMSSFIMSQEVRDSWQSRVHRVHKDEARRTGFLGVKLFSADPGSDWKGYEESPVIFGFIDANKILMGSGQVWGT